MAPDRAEVERLAIVGVMGSGSWTPPLAEPLGAALAALPAHLLTGGGAGAMEAVSRGFAAAETRRGKVLGVLPGAGQPPKPRPGYPNRWVEIAIRTHLPLSGENGEEPLSRNSINVLTADVIIALAGGAGTASEVRLALRFGAPILALLAPGEGIPGLPTDVVVVSKVEEAAAFARATLGYNPV